MTYKQVDPMTQLATRPKKPAKTSTKPTKPKPVKEKAAKGKAAAKEKPFVERKYAAFAKNFNAVLDANHFPSLHFGRQVEVGKMFGISTSAARKWVLGECLPDHDNLVMICDKLGVSMDTLFGRQERLGVAPMVSIPIGNAQAGSDKWLQPISAMQVEAEFLETGMRMQHNNLFLMKVVGDNMSPTLSDGDIVFVDATPIEGIRSIEENGIYLIMAYARPQIRRIFFGMDETVTLISDNKQFPPVTVPIGAFGSPKSKKPATLKLIGRIPWTIHRVGKASVQNN